MKKAFTEDVRDELISVMQARLERFEDMEDDARKLAEWVNTVAIDGSDIKAAARRYLSGVSNANATRVSAR